MSKAKLIELIKMDGLVFWNYFLGTPTHEVQQLLLQALKDVEQDTKWGCAEAISSHIVSSGGVILKDICLTNMAQCSCLNYQDKDLVGL